MDPLKMDMARKAAKRGPNPGQGIPNGNIRHLQAEVSMQTFSTKTGKARELYPGTKRLTRNQQAITGQEEAE